MNNEMFTEEGLKKFHPCKTCSNILTRDCFDDCILNCDFKHYRQRPGTDVKDLPPFPLDDVLDGNPRLRLVIIGIYLTALTDYIKNPEDYEKNQKLYGKEDYSI